MRATLLLSHCLKFARIGGETRRTLEAVARCAPMIGENRVYGASGLFGFKGPAVRMLCKCDQSLPHFHEMTVPEKPKSFHALSRLSQLMLTFSALTR